MRFFTVVLNLLCLGLLAFSKTDSPPLVDLGYATYQGLFSTSANITNFLGIRYAAPPVGEYFLSPPHSYLDGQILSLFLCPGNLRFQAPEPPLNTPGIQLAVTQPPACPQASKGTSATTPFRGLSKKSILDIEDCLFLKHVFVQNSDFSN